MYPQTPAALRQQSLSGPCWSEWAAVKITHFFFVASYLWIGSFFYGFLKFSFCHFLSSNDRKSSLEILLCSICLSPLWTLHWPWKVILCFYFQLWHWHCMDLQQCASSTYWPKSNSTFFFSNATQLSLMLFSQIVLYTQKETKIYNLHSVVMLL